MNNKKFENMLGDINVRDKITVKNRMRFNASLDKELLEDLKELMDALGKNYNIGFEAMMYLLMNNEEFLTEFLNEVKRR